jgi:hypothetical protein
VIAGCGPIIEDLLAERAVDQDGEVVDVFLQAQRFTSVHAAVINLFYLGRHLVRAEHYRNLRITAFNEWNRAVA